MNRQTEVLPEGLAPAIVHGIYEGQSSPEGRRRQAQNTNEGLRRLLDKRS